MLDFLLVTATFTARKRLGQGNVFTGVCPQGVSASGSGGVDTPHWTHTPWTTP